MNTKDPTCHNWNQAQPNKWITNYLKIGTALQNTERIKRKEVKEKERGPGSWRPAWERAETLLGLSHLKNGPCLSVQAVCAHLGLSSFPHLLCTQFRAQGGCSAVLRKSPGYPTLGNASRVKSAPMGSGAWDTENAWGQNPSGAGKSLNKSIWTFTRHRIVVAVVEGEGCIKPIF